ncbi:hypothetical protein [uncultured Microbulbifer sp.]|uniref:hypothetical protein n=1 Tax=uncultured Microbulbifer sp. TaxID=348147 RepID=UPI0026251ECD|nr:hypothetical protein [uncultured Microbulbifer sp.]
MEEFAQGLMLVTALNAAGQCQLSRSLKSWHGHRHQLRPGLALLVAPIGDGAELQLMLLPEIRITLSGHLNLLIIKNQESRENCPVFQMGILDRLRL